MWWGFFGTKNQPFNGILVATPCLPSKLQQAARALCSLYITCNPSPTEVNEK